MQLIDIQTLIRDDLTAVDQLILQRLGSDIPLIDKLAQYVITSGGKRLRPLILLLSAHCFTYQGSDHINLAAIVEFIHTATLLHDDVVDASALRRGNETANAIWGNEASVLVGDFLFSRSFQLMTEIKNLKVMEILAGASNTIARGEVLQLMNCHDPNCTEEAYIDVIQAKTARLFSAATQLGAVISEQPPTIEKAMEHYGLHLGTAFQLIDDVLDYQGSAATMGKNIGDDLAEGKPTLPLIYALKNAKDQQKVIIRRAILAGSIEKIGDIQQAIASTHAIEYTQERANKHVKMAVDALAPVPESDYKHALIALAQLTATRNH